MSARICVSRRFHVAMALAFFIILTRTHTHTHTLSTHTLSTHMRTTNAGLCMSSHSQPCVSHPCLFLSTDGHVQVSAALRARKRAREGSGRRNARGLCRVGAVGLRVFQEQEEEDRARCCSPACAGRRVRFFRGTDDSKRDHRERNHDEKTPGRRCRPLGCCKGDETTTRITCPPKFFRCRPLRPPTSLHTQLTQLSRLSRLALPSRADPGSKRSRMMSRPPSPRYAATVAETCRRPISHPPSPPRPTSSLLRLRLRRLQRKSPRR